MDKAELLNQADAVAQRAYAPYSHFRVGAALLCADGSVVTGCNVENRSFGLTICAERNAIAKALSLGKREFVAIAVSCPDSDVPVPPCGACRQVLSEFVGEDFEVHFRGSGSETKTVEMGSLLPYDSLTDLKHRLERD